MQPYYCFTCGETNPHKFYRRAKGQCCSCRSKAQVIAHRLNPEYQKRQAIYYRQWYALHGRKRNANYQDVIILWQSTHQDSLKVKRLVLKSIKQGLLERPLECAMCGRERCRINAHHNDYDFPYDIIWLCSSCHRIIHLQKGLDIFTKI